MKTKFGSFLMVIVVMSLALSACNTLAPATTSQAATQMVVTAPVEETVAPVQSGLLPEIDPSMVEGDIYAAGSSTVYPLMEAVAGLFEEEGYTGQVKIDSIGSGAGFDRFCKTAETDIANASRAAKDSDKENCVASGRNLVEFRVGTDAIAIVVSQQNDFLTDVTTEELAKLFTSEAVLWSDVNASWPSEPILRFTPGTDSGTFDFFVETVIQKPRKIEKLDDAKKLTLEAANLQLSEDDNVLVQGVEGSKYAIGYFGFAYYTNEAANLKAVSVNGVSPSLETAESGEYMLSRPLFIYSDAQVMKDKPQVASFIAFFLNRVNEVIQQVGYFPASEEALKASMQAWLDATNKLETRKNGGWQISANLLACRNKMCHN